ncbi:MAG TPA: helix-turn-helix domain-containing protein, partial [Gammaproteobacteria bacterium]
MSPEHDAADEQREPAAPPASPGQLLREARERAKQSLGDVAAQLNLTVTVIDALERDAYGQLPSAVFVRGYIKNYARLLGLPATDLVAQFDGQRAPDEPVNLRPRSMLPEPQQRGPLLRNLVLVLLLVAAVGGLWWLGGREFEQRGAASNDLLDRLLGSDSAP